MNSFSKGLLAFGASVLTLPSMANTSRAEGGVVYVNELPIARLLTPAAGRRPSERAVAAAARIAAIPTLYDIEVKTARRDRNLMVAGRAVLTATPAEAARHRTSVAALARLWADRLQAASDLPALKLEDAFAKLPVSGQRTIPLAGAEARTAKAISSAPEVVFAKTVGGGLYLRALRPGRATVTLTSRTGLENVDVEVRPFAAAFPQRLTTYVTGAPATGTTVRGAIQGALQTRFSAVDNARWTIGSVTASQVPTGRAQTYSVRVWAAAPGAYPASGLVNVTVKNAALSPQTDDNLWYSNDPETVRRPGPLFSASLKQGESARLLYHHLNAASQRMFLRVQAINDGDVPARVVLIPGDSRPDRNPVRAGQAAADQFVQNWVCGSGEVLTIPPHCTLPISLRSLAPGETTSGLCSVRLVDGPKDITVRTDAYPPFVVDARWQGALDSSTPWREVGTHPVNDYDRAPSEASQHIYPNPYKEEEVAYQVGGRYGFMRLGQRPIARQDADGSLDGNFGVIYNIKARLQNPTSTTADVELVFEASAGYSGGLFILNGRYIKTPLLQPKEETQIGRYRLSPGATQTIDITTLPLSGSSYPATITIRPIFMPAGTSPVRTGQSART